MAKKFNAQNEYTMVFSAALFEEIGRFQGLSFETARYLDVILQSGNHRFLKRSDVERDPQYKQLIPYAVLRCGDAVLTYRRGKLADEARLLQLYSMGIGGHISVDDPDLFGATYEQGLRREVHEEVAIECPHEQKAVALINDDTTDVGRVHFGVVHVFTLAEPAVRAKEKSINEVKFRPIPELRSMADKFENWSQICIAEIEEILSLGPAPPDGD